MKVLQICLKPPYPKADGGCIAMAAMTESMLAGGLSLKVLCMSTHKHPFTTTKVPKGILEKTQMEAIEMDTQIKPFDAFLNLFSPSSYNINRFHSKKFESKLVSVIKKEKAEIVLLESVFCTPYVETIRKHSKAKIVVRTHNIEFKIWEQLAFQETNPLKKWYFNFLAKRLKTYETDILKQVDGIIAITDEDKSDLKKMGTICPIEVIPIGINIDSITPKILDKKSIQLYHVGAMDWQPNIEGIDWFLDEIWPKLEQAFPTIECHLAGRNMPQSFISRANRNLKIVGEIDSVVGFVSDKNIAIIPLLSGSGMRVKIVEALSLGKVVITTTIGAAGIPFSEGKNLLIANSPNEFLNKIKQLFENPELIETIGRNARLLAEEAFDLRKLSSKLTYFYEHKL